MEIRRGPYGQYALKTVNGEVNTYAMEIISKTLLDNFLAISLTPSVVSEHEQLAYDCTGLISIESLSISEDNNRLILRKAAGDLFLSFLRCLDLLVPLTGIEWADACIFWDDTNKRFKMCLDPCIHTNINISLATLGYGNLESILSNNVFSSFLSQDEISGLSNAALTNNEQLFEELAIQIRSSDPQGILEKKTNPISNKETPINLTIIVIIISILCIFIRHPLLWAIGLIVCFIQCAIQFKKENNNKQIKQETIKSLTNTRKKLIFDEEPNNKTMQISCLILTSKQKINGNYISKALYTNKTTIGSDAFMSDICIPDDSINAIHAQILKNNNKYYLEDLSRDGTTYLENRRIEPEKQYEIKPGQVIRCGEYDFDISGF